MAVLIIPSMLVGNMFRSYWKDFEEKGYTLEVIVELTDDGGTGTMVDAISHPLGTKPDGEVLWKKE